MRLAWIADTPHYTGGAEMTQQEFLDATPEGVEVVRCKPGEVETDVDRAVVHTVTHYSLSDLRGLSKVPVTWFHHDCSPWNQPGVREFLNGHADHIFCSPMQRDKYGIDGPCIPPPLDLDRFKPPRQSKKRRKGTVSLAQWRGAGKGVHLLEEWAAKQDEVIDVWGSGDFPPVSDKIAFKGPIEPEYVPQLLWNYARFVFLPLELEPFCRTVAEAWAAGCRVITNNQIGATYWLRENPEAIKTAAADFWEAVLA
jgi:glycosyltransferase involved in cell wall biosynthesis